LAFRDAPRAFYQGFVGGANATADPIALPPAKP
jgi:hypothetical protein